MLKIIKESNLPELLHEAILLPFKNLGSSDDLFGKAKRLLKKYETKRQDSDY